jgi:hypothetical protein
VRKVLAILELTELPTRDRPTPATWDAHVLGPSDSPTHQDEPRFLVCLNTPNDPEHWAYGEDGPTFELREIRDLVYQGDGAMDRVHLDERWGFLLERLEPGDEPRG